MLHSAEIFFAYSIARSLNSNTFVKAVKATVLQKTAIGDFPHPMTVKLAIFVVEYLCEYESIPETALAHKSGEPGLSFDANLMRLSL
jgi:hypothetical protein